MLFEDFKYISSQKLPWNKSEKKTILISGANGFIPSYIIEYLLYLNDLKKTKIKIIGIVRNKQKALTKFAKCKNRKDFKLIFQDISCPLKINESIHYIIHAASQASPKYYHTDPVGTLKPNILGTYNLLELARQNPVESFLFLSAGETYGNISIPGRTDESTYGSLDPTQIRSCYAESKRMGETMCVSWYHQYKVPAKIVRLYHTYGPGIKLDDGRVFADFIANIVRGENINMKSRGEAVRSFIYIADSVSGLFTVLLKGKNGEAYNVANQKATISVRRLAQTLVRLFPEKKLKVIMQKRKNTDRYVESPIKFNYPLTLKLESLGWKPHFTIEKGFLKTIQSFR